MAKILVTFYSQTGNTVRVAEAIFEAVRGEKIILPMDQVDSLDGYDLIFIGFPVMQFGPPRILKKFLEERVAEKRVALFVTHAMFSNSSDPQQSEMLEKELERCRAACSRSELAGFFHCQGELSEKIAGSMTSSGIPMLAEFASMRPGTICHPDSEELLMAGRFAAELAAEMTLNDGSS